ncbi:hypothetical protein AVDCRST_MAG94-959 [uncultured Leptolyngbya sp.]|uniref:Uncharacterized protein n=1 Tax=uncultured Leptolyngbya sp. TaxID=332963 RepID=A0A6J4KR67_9CYAN|nr:hypothetical protein AVDCRST_MAG94-959 [uncultured Leptolyngbya sp.]
MKRCYVFARLNGIPSGLSIVDRPGFARSFIMRSSLASSSCKQTHPKQAQCLRFTAALTFRLPQIISSVHTPKGSVRIESTCFLLA